MRISLLRLETTNCTDLELMERLRERDASGDPESAHEAEDVLLWRLVRLVEGGDQQAALLLAKTLALYDRMNADRGRWYA